MRSRHIYWVCWSYFWLYITTTLSTRPKTLWNNFLQFLRTTWDAALMQRLHCPLNHLLNLCFNPNGQCHTLHWHHWRQLHSGHPGINWMKSIARSVVYWPNIGTDIERTVKHCIQGIIAQKNPPQIVDSRWTYPEQTWSRIHVDFVGPINGLSFLSQTAI